MNCIVVINDVISVFCIINYENSYQLLSTFKKYSPNPNFSKICKHILHIY